MVQIIYAGSAREQEPENDTGTQRVISTHSLFITILTLCSMGSTVTTHRITIRSFLRTLRKFFQKRKYNRGLRGWTRINAFLIRVNPRHPRSKSYWIAALPRWVFSPPLSFIHHLHMAGYG